MNSTATHDNKDWHTMSHHHQQAACMNENSPVVSHQQHSPQIQQHYSPMPPSMDHQQQQQHYYAQGSMPPPPVHHSLPPSSNNNNFMPPPPSTVAGGKSESDPRLPGMMALSQPGTPRPGHQSSPTTPTKNKAPTTSYTTSYHAAAASPYAHPALTGARKSRGNTGRNELFSSSTELGPFFSSTKPFDNLYALDRSTLLTLRIQAKMDRGFFLADNDWTCYRRNYFQVSGAFAIHGLNHHAYYSSDQESQCLVQVDGHFYPVYNFSMNISARVSNSDKKIDLVQHTPKRDKGPQSTPQAKLIMPGGNLQMSSVGANQSIVTFERIQFKTATANNGKRRAAQQYYVCLVDLYAEIDNHGNHQKVKIASCQSAPLVVRGRSPGHYSDNHDRYENNMSISVPPPLPHHHHHDDRFNNGGFPRPPMTPPGMMGGPSPSAASSSEYGQTSPYGPPPPHSYPYNNFPAAPAPHYMQQQQQQGIMMNHSTPPTPTSGHPSQQQNGSYMVPSMTNDPSSSESSSPDLYNSQNGGAEYHHHGEESKLQHPSHQHHQQQGSMTMHMPPNTTPMDHNEWHRGRMNSVGSHPMHSPIPGSATTPFEQQQQQHTSYFNQAPAPAPPSSNSSAPSTPYGGPVVAPRKYSQHNIQQAS